MTEAGDRREHRVHRDGVDLIVVEQGPGDGPPVVLLHGLTATRRYVVMGSNALPRAGFRTLAYDARGHGASTPAPQPGAYAYADLADDLHGVLDGAGVERAVLAGASMGAHTLLRFALEHPERVAGLVAVTPAYDPAAPADEARDRRWHELAAGLRTGGVEGFMAVYAQGELPERLRDTVLTVVRQRLGRHEHAEAVADALDVVPFSAPFGAIEDLAALDVPAAVVASRDDADPEHPLAVGEAYAEALPRAQLIVEDPGAAPLAWQGAQLSKVIADVAGRSA